jgi:hypothetical protein
MAVHMTVQMPLLACVGLLLASILRPRGPPWLVEADWRGIPGLLAVVFATSFWMLPRMLDAALAHPLIDLAKFVTLPLLVGLPMGLSWPRLPGLGRAFLWANFIPSWVRSAASTSALRAAFAPTIGSTSRRRQVGR